MKVKTLITKLQHMDPEATCVYAVDDEGNSYSKVFYFPSMGKYDESKREFVEIDDPEHSCAEGIKAVCIN